MKWLKDIFSSASFWMMAVTVFFTVGAAWLAPAKYKKVVDKSNVSIPFSGESISVNSELPVWIRIDSVSLVTNKALGAQEVMELRLLVSDTCAYYQTYLKSVGELAYKSNNDTTNLTDLIWLTLCYVMLGCSARTLYDYIGRKCYLHDQKMSVWWPWYFFRPLICAPIAGLLIVSIRTSIFSNLFVSKDLNTYLVISFLSGFALMEFLTMLRRVSKSLFDSHSSTAKKEEAAHKV